MTTQDAADRRFASRVNTNAVLTLVAVAQFMTILDASVVNVALPTIRNQLGFSEQGLSWVVSAYTLVFGGFLLLAGRAADRLGRRRLLVAGVALFATASLICGFSQSAVMLVVARGAQGLGGAMVSPAALSIILTTFAEGPRRNRALAIWGAIAGAGGAIGLLLGGVIVQAISWRWVFFLNAPVGAVLLALTPRVIPESRSPAAAKSGYDVWGAITITLGTIALVFTLLNAESWGWGSGTTIAGFGVAAVLTGTFVVIEQRHKDPLVPLRIFTDRSLAAADASFLLVSAALFGMFYFCTLYLQQVLGYNALETGLAFLPLSLTLIVASSLASRVVDRFTPKPVLVAGLLIATGGFVLLTQLSGDGDYATRVLPAMVILGLGLGMSFVPATIAATTGVAPEDAGLASGLLNTTQEVGGSLGLAILATISTGGVTTALQGGAALPDALTHGFKGGFVVGGVLCGAGAALALVLLPRRERAVENEQVATMAMSTARCQGAPYCGHLARVAAFGRRMKAATAALR